MMAINKYFILKIFSKTLIWAVLLVFCMVSVTQALGEDQKKLYTKNILYYDIDACAVSPTDNDEQANTNNSLSSYVMIGDSITVGAKDALVSKFEEKGKTISINASVSRSIDKKGTTSGYQTSGLQAVDTAKTDIEKADAVIVALGTNKDTNFKSKIEDMVKKVKEVNQNASIFWVNVFAKQTSYQAENSAIEESASSLGYTVIDTTSASIELGGDKIHPTQKGSGEFATLVADKAASGSKTVALPTDLREKIGQLMFVGATNSEDDMVELVQKYKIGGVMLTNESTSLYGKSAIQKLKDASSLPLLIASDEEGGLVQRLKELTGKYPSAKSLGGKSSEEVKKIASEYGKKLADLGVNVNYAPVLDIDDGHNSVISQNNRAFSGDPQKIADKAGAFADGMRESGVTPVFKHFPGHGRADGDSHTRAVKTPSLSALKQTDLKPYETLLKKGGSGVMMGHLVVPGLTESSTYKQTSINKNAYDLLRDDYSFDGVIFTDEIANMKAIADRYSPAEAVALAIRAGADMPLFNFSSKYGSIDEQVKKTIDKVEQDVNDNKIKKSEIDASLQRIQSIKNTGNSNQSQTEKLSDDCACTNSGNDDSALTGSTGAIKAYNYFIGKPAELSSIAAAGIVGNLMRESGGDSEDLNPKIVSPDGMYNGIAQWDTPGRWAALKRYASEKRKDHLSLSLQLEYIWYELSTNPLNGLEELKSATSPDQAAAIFDEKFERSSHGRTQRMENAVKFYENHVTGGNSQINDGGPSESNTSAGCEDPASGGDGESTGELSWPLPKKFAVGGCWNEHRDYYPAGTGHSGMDIPAPRGTPVNAADGGDVEYVADRGGASFGRVIIIKHKNGLRTLYGHLHEMKVKKGDKVSKGQVIGSVNNTGHSFGDHLHFNVQKVPGEQGNSGTTLNPLDYLPNDGRNMSTGKGVCGPGSSGYKSR